MIVPLVVLALMLQARPAAAPASISGVVVQNGTNEPLANVKVSLARTDLPLGAFGQMVAGERPPGDLTIPSELLRALADRMAEEAANSNLPPEAAAEAKAVAALPIAEMEEVTVSVNGDIAIVMKSTPPMMTDSQGRFAFNDVGPGTYKLIFASNGYARQSYGQRGVGGTGVPIVLTAGQTKADILMQMSQVAAIGGKIVDSSGRPIAGVPVRLIRYAYDDTGQRKVVVAASTQTDDHGDYRIFHLSPGRYYLSAGNLPGQSSSNNIPTGLLGPGIVTVANSNRIPENYTLSYYPGADDASSATPIDLPPGADFNGANMSLRVQQTFRVRGSVVDPRTGQPPLSVNLSLNLQNPDPRGGSFVNTSDGRPTYNGADGTFELRNVSSGAYTITAMMPNPAPPRPADLGNLSPADQRAYFDAQNATSSLAPRAFAAINIRNSDIDGIQLRVAPAGNIIGRFRFDQDPSIPSPGPTFLRIQLRDVNGSITATPTGIAAQSRATGADGTFRVDNIPQGEYRLALVGIPDGYYLKEARFGDLDLLSGSLRYAGTDSRTLDVVLRSGTGNVEGNAVNSQGQPAAGARVVLIPERRDRTELFRPATADPNGRFTIPNIAPGDYKLVAWESIEPFEFFDVERIKQADDKGTEIRVTESSRQSVNVIPIR